MLFSSAIPARYYGWTTDENISLNHNKKNLPERVFQKHEILIQNNTFRIQLGAESCAGDLRRCFSVRCSIDEIFENTPPRVGNSRSASSAFRASSKEHKLVGSEPLLLVASDTDLCLQHRLGGFC